MKVVTIRISSTSSNTAEANAMILRETKTSRILYVPKIVVNTKNIEESIGGAIIAQRKGINEEWENYDDISLNTMKKGEWTKFNIELGEMLNLIEYASKLKELYDRDKSIKRVTEKQIMILDDNMDKNEVEQFNEYVKSNPKTVEVLNKLINNNVEISKTLDLFKEDPSKLASILSDLDYEVKDEMFNYLKIKIIDTKYLKENLLNDTESFWQNLFKKHPNILSSVIPSMAHIIADQPYMGGKAIDNTGSTIGDFIFKCGSKNVSIVEIKTPTARLVGKKYRDNSFSPSDELSGAVVQVIQQKDSHIKNYIPAKLNSIRKKIDYDSFNPKTYLIIGNTTNMQSEEIESFELFRNGLKDVEIITFNELIGKLDLLIEYLK